MDDDAFTALLHEHAGLLSRIAASYEADAALRDDLLQDIAMALWKALPSWRGDAALKTYVARVAHNRGATHAAGQCRRPRETAIDETLMDGGVAPERHAQLDQQRVRLQQAVRGLPLGLRQAVTLALEGFSHREVAQTLGITENNVGVRLNRARAALHAVLGERS